VAGVRRFPRDDPAAVMERNGHGRGGGVEGEQQHG